MMITIFNRVNIYIGFDLTEFNRIREAFEYHKIKYSYHVKNQMGQWTGRGTLRGNLGSAAQPSNLFYEYEIFVHKKDKEQAIKAMQKIV